MLFKEGGGARRIGCGGGSLKGALCISDVKNKLNLHTRVVEASGVRGAVSGAVWESGLDHLCSAPPHGWEGRPIHGHVLHAGMLHNAPRKGLQPKRSILCPVEWQGCRAYPVFLVLKLVLGILGSVPPRPSGHPSQEPGLWKLF